MLTVYATLMEEIDMNTLISGLPKNCTASIVDSWTTEKTFQVSEKESEGKFKMVFKKKIQYHGILLIDKETVNPLKKYARFQINKNVYPRDFQDDTCFYVKLNPNEKNEIQRLFEAFSKVSDSKIPNYISKNGFGFYQFEEKDKNLLPTILGMLRNYPSLNDATLKFAIKKNQNQPQKENKKNELKNVSVEEFGQKNKNKFFQKWKYQSKTLEY